MYAFLEQHNIKICLTDLTCKYSFGECQYQGTSVSLVKPCFAFWNAIINQKYPSLVQKQKTCTVFLLSYTNTSGSLGEREMLWEHEPQASVSTAFSSSPKLARVFV